MTGRLISLFLIAMTLASPGLAQTEAPVNNLQEETQQSQQAQLIRRLQQIKQVQETRREQLRNLLERLSSADALEKAKIEEQIATLRQSVAELGQAFEKIALGGVNLRNLAEAQNQKLDWRDELMQIARPILNSLKEATEKPRKIEQLRSTISLNEQQLEMITKATDSLADFEARQLPAEVASGFRELAASLRERRSEVERTLEVSRNELHSLEGEDTEIFATLAGVLHDFGTGRGLTLLLALITGIAVWFLLRGLRWLISLRRRARENTGLAARFRLILYSYHLFTLLLVSLAVLSVFYVRGDLLLLSLAIIALVMLTLGVWRVLPGYIHEARLLLNAGAARQGERVIYNGLPFRIDSLNLHSRLRNPELEGVLRLPLSTIAQLTSRPSSDEAWFPSSSGDYLLLPDGGFGQVIQQTVELVRVKMLGSIVQFFSADFLQLNPRNLSREGFAVVVVFGIDYDHQAIALDLVPQRFKAGLESAFEDSDYGKNLKDLLVEFKQAGTNSLDYLIYANMDGRAAASYFAIERFIQQTCVDICNQQAWGIPFAQVTIHQAGDASEDADADLAQRD